MPRGGMCDICNLPQDKYIFFKLDQRVMSVSEFPKEPWPRVKLLRYEYLKNLSFFRGAAVC